MAYYEDHRGEVDLLVARQMGNGALQLTQCAPTLLPGSDRCKMPSASRDRRCVTIEDVSGLALRSQISRPMRMSRSSCAGCGSTARLRRGGPPPRSSGASNAERCPVHIVIWAACAKDPGFGPLLLLNQMRRHSRVDPAELREMGASMEPQALKVQWLEHAARSETELERAGSAGVDVGLAFVSARGEIGWFDQPGYLPHRATLGGALPRIVDTPLEPE